MSNVRQKMIEGTAALLARKGVQATSFGEILKATGTPRGSIYHHFPEGKDQLIEEAIDLLGSKAFQPIDEHAGASAEFIARMFIEQWRAYLIGSQLRAGCAVLAVTVTTDSARLIARTAVVFQAWRNRLSNLLASGGLSEDDADGFAAMLIAAVEGAMVFSRAEKSLESFDLVAAHLLKQVRLSSSKKSNSRKASPKSRRQP